METNNMFYELKEWLQCRLEERTTIDGALLVAFGLVMLILPMDLFAYAAIIYGIWTMWKSE
jgi:hypothetical protein|tara:strand:+ start:41 stop:223 length:183 start_codon:yes stop_codon:yes gene_type:complete